MIYDEIADTLLRAGIPVNTKGFIYIHDALELMDKDPYYFSGKIWCVIRKDSQAERSQFAQVERGDTAYAFEGALTRWGFEIGGALSGPRQYPKLQSTQSLVSAVETGLTSERDSFMQ